MIERKNKIYHGAGVVAGSPAPKDILHTKKKEIRGDCSLSPRLASTHAVAISIYPEEKRNKQGKCLMGKLKEQGAVGDVINYLIVPI